MKQFELTLLSEGQICGNEEEKQLEVLKKYGTKAAITDLGILTGGYVNRDYYISDEENFFSELAGGYWTKSIDANDGICVFCIDGSKDYSIRSSRISAVRPIFQSSTIFNQIYLNKKRGYNGTNEVEFGEYPQYCVTKYMNNRLEKKYKSGINKTGKTYTFNLAKDGNSKIEPLTHEEYEYQGKKYIRVKANTCLNGRKIELSNGCKYKDGDIVWVEVLPVVWLIDEETQTLISKRGLVSGIRFDGTFETGEFETTEMYEFLNKYMIKDIFQSVDLEKMKEPTIEELANKKNNPYNFELVKVSEEEIIRGSIESNVPVFLHGPSSEGKSARVKQIDADCVIIYLRNATPDSLNGKSVYNSETNEMIDIKPTWLKKLEGKCESEPDKLHILFFDEITNALPSIQGSAFNIVLDREVNGIWKLPENVRIVAAGNEMNDSLAANKLAEPLFNRFAHVYINTTCESWLKWASENNIHPAIYSYIAYKKGEVLRSKYDGEKPNADPRKWEMASKMLYSTNNPEMLRALVGEDITKEFVRFCNQPVITLKDVINGNYTNEEIEHLNTSERYATVMNLSQVDEDNIIIVRDFVKNLGAEFTSLFDCLWTHNDEKRLEIIAEAKLGEKSKSK